MLQCLRLVRASVKHHRLADHNGQYAKPRYWHAPAPKLAKHDTIWRMPTYEYRCNSCAQTMEVFARMSDPDPTTCESCGAVGQLEKVLFAPAVHYKGSGFYSTDYKGKRSAPTSSESSAASEKSGSESSSSDSAAKADAASSAPAGSGTGSSTDSGPSKQSSASSGD